MNEANLNVTISGDDSSSAIAIPASPEKIGKFISSLLGQPQSISREITGVFDLDLSWFLHLNALIDQRIKQQNNSSQVSFRATILYSDRTNRNLETVEAFQHFAETKKLRSVGITLQWTYLIVFPGKELPEKQQIQVSAREKVPTYGLSEVPSIRRRARAQLGLVSYSISHTERTWGDDIETILRNAIDAATKKTAWYEDYYETAMMLLGLILFGAGFIVPDYVNDVLVDRYNQTLPIIEVRASPAQQPTIAEVSQKLDLLVKVLDPRAHAPRVGIKYRIISAAAGFGLLFWCMWLSDVGRSSFINLTPESAVHRSETLRKEQRRALILLFSFFTSVATGVASNYVYLYLTK